MEFKIEKSSVLKISIDGVAYELRKPKMRELIEQQKQFESTDLQGAVERSLEWVCSLGLPREIALDLDQDAFLELIRYINGSKKN